MVQAGQDGGDEGFEDLLLPDAAQEAQGDPPQELVGVLQVVAQVLADQDLRTAGQLLARALHGSLAVHSGCRTGGAQVVRLLLDAALVLDKLDG